MDGQEGESRATGGLKRVLTEARSGVVGNAAWGGLLLVALGAAKFVGGEVPAWLFVIALAISLALAGFIVDAMRRKSDFVSGQLAEARQHEQEAITRLRASERLQAELRDQIANAPSRASTGEVAMSVRAQAYVRRVRALRSTSNDNDGFGPGDGQIELLVSLVKDIEGDLDAGDTLNTLMNRWARQDEGRTWDAWFAALETLEAITTNVGVNDALGAPEWQ
jgi:hypothetical protein